MSKRSCFVETNRTLFLHHFCLISLDAGAAFVVFVVVVVVCGHSLCLPCGQFRVATELGPALDEL